MNAIVKTNYSKLKPTLFFLPLLLLLIIFLLLYNHGSLNANNYIQVQKDCFYYINYNLGQYPNITYNLTQIGDASIFLSFLIIFIVYAPKMWEALLSASLVSLVASNFLKNLFLVPRPSEVFDNNSFVIIGKAATGFASLPSGHSITVFTTLTVLMYAFIPKDIKFKILWFFSIIIIGLCIVFTRVGVGAHYPLDVIIGSIVGYISGLTGILMSQKFKIWNWINNKKCYPIFMLLILIASISLINKIINENLIVFYLALISLFVSLYKIIYVYVKK